jgi:hypothetical protein
LISSSLRKMPLNLILRATLAKDCWNRIMQLIDKIFHMTLSDSKPLELQIDMIIQASHTMADLGLALEDCLVVFVVISNLLSLLSIIKKILANLDSTLITYENIKSKII